jgi:hypothetical protein
VNGQKQRRAPLVGVKQRRTTMIPAAHPVNYSTAEIRKLAQGALKVGATGAAAYFDEIRDTHGIAVLRAVVAWLQRAAERERNRQIRYQREDAILQACIKDLDENFPPGTTLGEAMAIRSGRTSLSKQ